MRMPFVVGFRHFCLNKTWDLDWDTQISSNPNLNKTRPKSGTFTQKARIFWVLLWAEIKTFESCKGCVLVIESLEVPCLVVLLFFLCFYRNLGQNFFSEPRTKHMFGLGQFDSKKSSLWCEYCINFRSEKIHQSVGILFLISYKFFWVYEQKTTSIPYYCLMIFWLYLIGETKTEISVSVAKPLLKIM